jgi:DNA-binding LacI/PurR family transcriptional regulator
MQTLRKALSLLADEGLIERRTGAGTFVANPAAPPTKIDHVGILLHAHADSYGMRISGNIANIANAQSLTLHTHLVSDFQEQAIKALNEMARAGCPCAIVPWLPWDQSSSLADLVRHAPIPLSVPVALPGLDKHYFSEPRTFGVSGTHYMQLAGQYLHQLGCTQIAFVGPYLRQNITLERRIIGYTLFCAEYELDNHCHLLLPDHGKMDQLARKLAAFRGSLGVVCFDDEHALRLMTAMHKLGLQAPLDFRILGWNNTPACESSDPPLSSFYGDYEHPAQWMLKNAIGLAQGKVVQERHCKPMYLKIRQSCGGRRLPDADLQNLLANIGLAEGPQKGSDHA